MECGLDSMHWNGYYLINEMVLDTVYRIRVSDARDDSFPFPIPVDTRGTFRVYTAGSASRELSANSVSNGVKLSWHHSSITNLLGYNIYRDTVSGGPYTLVNSKVITDTTYTDTTMAHGKTSYYVYTIMDNNFHESSYSSEASASIGTDEANKLPKVFSLSTGQNPFRNQTLIKYAVPNRTDVSIKVYNISGALVNTITQGIHKPGYYSVNWEGKDSNGKKLGSGIYFIKFSGGNYKATKKLILMR